MNPDRKKIFAYSGPVVLFLAAALLSLFFRYPVQIIDALSTEAVPGFDIYISPWRVLFEPFFGPLLFYLRADQAVKEFTILLYWILALTLLYSLAASVFPGQQDGGKPTRKALLSWLKNTPLILATWLGLLWLIIYVPLPSNTIVNQQEHSILINTHSHTEYSHDGIISTKGLQKWHKKNGFDAFFLTDHNHHLKTMEAVKAQDDGLFPKEPLMLIGEEYSGSNHMTLLGLKRNFITRGLSDQQVIDSTHEDQGVVLVAHWFDGERQSIPYYLDMGVDGFEIANQGYGLAYEPGIFKAITEACSSRGLIMNGAADYHGYGSSCFVWNALDIPGWKQMEAEGKREAIMEVLRRKDRSRIRVLLYSDRRVFDRSRVVLSPVYNLVNYFRTLKVLQLLSWLFWLVALTYLHGRLAKRNKGPVSFRILQAVALTGSLFLLLNGILLKLKVRELSGYNEIYGEYGTLLLSCGAGFLLYSLVLLFVEFKRKKA